jgi:ABC-2 type transport system ATP-binding protein
MVKVDNLTKYYGNQIAVNNISFQANKGEILGFLGPNGAGKSTTMKMITSFIKQDKGAINVCGHDTVEQAGDTKKKIGYLPENNPLYFDMYVKEFLTFAGKIYKLSSLDTKIKEVINITGLEKEQHKVIGALSKGYRQRVGLAQALLHDPEVLIMDEPTSGLDMNQLIDIRSLIKYLGKEKTVIFSTHIMQEVQALCDRVVIINEGSIVADDPISELQNRIKGNNIIHITFHESNIDTNLLQTIEGIDKIELVDNKCKIVSSTADDIRPLIFRLCAKENYTIIEMNMEKQNIEYIFQKLTKSQ